MIRKQTYKELEGQRRDFFIISIIIFIFFIIALLCWTYDVNKRQKQITQCQEQKIGYGFSTDGYLWIKGKDYIESYKYFNGSWYRDGVKFLDSRTGSFTSLIDSTGYNITLSPENGWEGYTIWIGSIRKSNEVSKDDIWWNDSKNKLEWKDW